MKNFIGKNSVKNSEINFRLISTQKILGQQFLGAFAFLFTIFSRNFNLKSLSISVIGIAILSFFIALLLSMTGILIVLRMFYLI